MRILAGIDGGGTRTRLALSFEDGNLMGYAEAGSCSFIDLGRDAAREELARVWASGWGAAGAVPSRSDALFMGLGSVLSEADARTNCDLAVELGLSEARNVRADNDAWNAHAGALMGGPGLLVISGTGSVCLGRSESGAVWRAGGWGHLLNDIGSAYALGHEALIAATRDADGRGNATTLTALVRETLGLTNMKEIFRRVHYEGVPRAAIAALAPNVVRHACGGDKTAEAILNRNAEGLAEMAATAARKLNLTAPKVALRGGLITNAEMFRRLFLDKLAFQLPGFTLVDDGLDPVFGAVLLARMQLDGAEFPARFINNLRASAARLQSP
jgi:N-acetylglucosamine kinase-like BadF-type ATPase